MGVLGQVWTCLQFVVTSVVTPGSTQCSGDVCSVLALTQVNSDV